MRLQLCKQQNVKPQTGSGIAELIGEVDGCEQTMGPCTLLRGPTIVQLALCRAKCRVVPSIPPYKSWQPGYALHCVQGMRGGRGCCCTNACAYQTGNTKCAALKRLFSENAQG